MDNSIKKLIACSILSINALLVPSQTTTHSSNRGTWIVAAITASIAIPTFYRYATSHKDLEVSNAVQATLENISIPRINLEDHSENNAIQFFNQLCPDQPICEMNPQAVIKEKQRQVEDLLSLDFLFRTLFSPYMNLQKANIKGKLVSIEQARQFAKRHNVLVRAVQNITEKQKLIIPNINVFNISSLPILNSSNKLTEYVNKLDRAIESINPYRTLQNQYPDLSQRATATSTQLYTLKTATQSLPEYRIEEDALARQQARELEQRRVAALENQAQAQRHSAYAQAQQASAQAKQARVDEQRVALEQENRNIQKYIAQHQHLTADQAREQYHNRNDTMNMIGAAIRIGASFWN